MLPLQLSTPPLTSLYGAAKMHRAPTPSPSSTTSVYLHKYSYRRQGIMVRRQHCVYPCAAGLQATVPDCRGGGRAFLHRVLGVRRAAPGRAASRANTIQHYSLLCRTVRHLLPRGQPLDVVSRQLLDHNVLVNILLRHPRFDGWK